MIHQNGVHQTNLADIKWSLQRLCFYTFQSFCPQGNGVSIQDRVLPGQRPICTETLWTAVGEKTESGNIQSLFSCVPNISRKRNNSLTCNWLSFITKRSHIKLYTDKVCLPTVYVSCNWTTITLCWFDNMVFTSLVTKSKRINSVLLCHHTWLTDWVDTNNISLHYRNC